MELMILLLSVDGHEVNIYGVMETFCTFKCNENLGVNYLWRASLHFSRKA